MVGYRELAELTVDLPARPPCLDVTQAKHRAICSKLVRRGSWEIPERSSWRSLFGTIVLDLREARLAGPVVELEIHNTFGAVTVLVPAGVQLDVEGTAPFASQVIEPPSRPPPPGAPRLRIRTKDPAERCTCARPDHASNPSATCPGGRQR